MKKMMKRISAVLLCLVILAGSFAFPKLKAEAASTMETRTAYLAPNGNTASKQYKLYYTSKVSGVKSSNKSVGTASVKKEKDAWVLTVSLKKAGSTIISYKNSRGNTIKFKLAVKKYTSPVKSIKIGKTTLTSKYKNSYQITGGALNGKVSVTTKNGWKLVKAWKFKTSLLTSKKSVKQISVNLSKSIKVTKGYRLILQFKKGSQTMSLLYDVK